MNKNYSLKQDGSFHIENYNHTHPFSNFLPGIAGKWGIPLWAFYVNRGQAIASFGISDKDHAILEFFPANKSYWLTELAGFRTFLKINDSTFYEPFRSNSKYKRSQQMIIKSASLEIKEINHDLGLEFTVKYFTVPNASVGALARHLTIKNISKKKLNIEVIDGLARIVPLGTTNFFLKKMSRTIQAWMHANIDKNLATFRLIVDPKDVSETEYIQGANFNYSFYEQKGKKILPYLIVDPVSLFGQDKSYSFPSKFVSKDFKLPLSQIYCCRTPCAFSLFKWSLSSAESRSFYSVFGSSPKMRLINNFTKQLSANLLKKKEIENEKVISSIKSNALCVSGHDEFNHYVQTSYLDNVLRGGWPLTFDKKHTYYIFSRKHGDLERDYNRFSLLPSYFSEGESNYRDINQNRRMDLFFNPFIENKNIIYFLNFIKIDGYNPLVIQGEKLYLSRKESGALLKEFKIKDKRVLILMEAGFYLGEVFKFLEEQDILITKREKFAKLLIEKAQREPIASFGEGYWIDHWRYTLDAIESFLYFYPDKIKELFLDKDYMFWDDALKVKDRKNRYYLKNKKVYQGQGIEHIDKKYRIIQRRDQLNNFLRTNSGKIYKTNLVNKLLNLILIKSATLDPEGIGIEMEADKPGWCDSLNGLPAIFGSSICETLELKRTALVLLDALKYLQDQDKGVSTIDVSLEISSLLNKMSGLLKQYSSSKNKNRDYTWWDKSNTIKEDFRKETFFSVKGKSKAIKLQYLQDFLKSLIKKLDIGIKKAKDKKSNVCNTYFRYDVVKYQLKNGQIMPSQFNKNALPLFLEGPMHALRVDKDKRIYRSVKASSLFDKELGMYRLNSSLKKEPLDIGRSRVFVPGWLENESIWLHMQYKYLLEVLRNGMYDEFFKDFYKACVCFLEPEKYGRNILENSSFIVSSAYPDKSLWGKGFVARLSGATAELLNIWIVLCLGIKPFFIDEDGRLCVRFAPILKKEMFTKSSQSLEYKGKKITIPKNSFAFKLFSSCLVVYHNPKRKDTFRGLKAKHITAQLGGKKHALTSDILKPPLSYALREAKIDRIDIFLG